MMRWAVRTGWLLIIGMLLGMSWQLGAVRQTPEPPGDPADPALLIDRPWIDHMPSGRNEPFRIVFLSTSRDQGKFLGMYVLADSVYKRTTEFFYHETDKQEVRYTFPHDNTRAVSPFSLENVSGNRDFDLKLTLKRDPRGQTAQQIYFSRKEWGNAENVPPIVENAVQAAGL